MYYLILKNGEYAEGDFKPEGSTEVSRRPPRLETTWDGSTWVETDNSKAQEYARKRAEAYPSVGDQLDMIYKDMKNSTTTHAEAVEAVKTKFPKE